MMGKLFYHVHLFLNREVLLPLAGIYEGITFEDKED
jgi:hypothetical protein